MYQPPSSVTLPLLVGVPGTNPTVATAYSLSVRSPNPALVPTNGNGTKKSEPLAVRNNIARGYREYRLGAFYPRRYMQHQRVGKAMTSGPKVGGVRPLVLGKLR